MACAGVGCREQRKPGARLAQAFASPRLTVLAAALALMGLRPVIDLQGRYQGDGINAGGLVGILVAALLLVAVVLDRKRLARPAVGLCLIALGIVLTSGLMLVRHGIVEVASLARVAVGLSALLLLCFATRRRGAELGAMLVVAVRVLLLASLVPIAIGWSQYVGLVPYTYFDYYDGQAIGRVSGGYFQPNSLSRLMVFDVLLIVLLAWSGHVRARWIGPALVLFAATTFVTTHRTSIAALVWILAVVALATIAERGLRSPRLSWTRLAAGAGVALAVGGFVLTPVGRDVASSLSTTARVATSPLRTLTEASPSDDVFLRGRGRIWRSAIERFRSEGVLVRLFGLGYQPFEAHNDTLRILLMHGVVGLGAYATLFAVLLGWGLAATDSRGSVALIALFGYLFLYGIALHPTAYPLFMWLFFLSFATIMTLFPRRRAGDAGARRIQAGPA